MSVVMALAARIPLLGVATNPLRDLEQRLATWGYTALTLLAIGMLVWVILKIRERVIGDNDREISPEELLTRYQSLKRNGELTDEEYRRIATQIQQGPTGRPEPKIRPVLPVAANTAPLENSELPTDRQFPPEQPDH